MFVSAAGKHARITAPWVTELSRGGREFLIPLVKSELKQRRS